MQKNLIIGSRVSQDSNLNFDCMDQTIKGKNEVGRWKIHGVGISICRELFNVLFPHKNGQHVAICGNFNLDPISIIPLYS